MRRTTDSMASRQEYFFWRMPSARSHALRCHNSSVIVSAVVSRALGDRNVVSVAPRKSIGIPRARVLEIPRAIRWPEHSEVGLPVPVVVRRHGYVAGAAPLEAGERSGARVLQVPHAVRRAEDGDVRLAVAVVVSWDRNI